MDAVLSVMVFSVLFPVVLLDLSEQDYQESGRWKRNENSVSAYNAKSNSTTRDRISSSAMINGLLTGYDRDDPPRRDGPTEVGIGIYINDFISVSEQRFAYSVNMYLRQSWTDPRLAFEPTRGITRVKMGEHNWNGIWLPDTFFRNEKDSAFHTMTVPNRLLTIDHTGLVWYVSKITVTLSCPMNLRNYPMDTQVCPMMFESFGYRTDTLRYVWLGESPVDVDSDVTLPQFVIERSTTHDCTKNYTTGTYPCLKILFKLRRDLGYSLLQVYFPSITVVILSWLAFIVDISNTPERMSIGFLMILSILTISNGSQSQLPKVSYIKAIDAWMFVCTVFVFATLIEFGVVNMVYRKSARALGYSPSLRDDKDEDKVRARLRRNGRELCETIDRACVVCFPVLFMIFNLIYWIVYTRPGFGDEYSEHRTR